MLSVIEKEESMIRLLATATTLLMIGCSSEPKSGTDLRLTDFTIAKDYDDARAKSDAVPSDLVSTRDTLSANDKLVLKDLTNACGATIGSATVSGSVQGTAISASNAAGVKFTVGGLVGFGLFFFNQAGTCSSVAQAGQGIYTLGITLCANAPGTYKVGGNCFKDGGGTSISLSNSVQTLSTSTKHKASDGTITIESLDFACGGSVKGSFSVSFSGEPVKGTFNSVGCGTLSQ
jgi:hypothetical protein